MAGLVVCDPYWLVFDVPCIMVVSMHAHTCTHTIIMRAAICTVAVIKLLALYRGCFKAQTPFAITQVICQQLVINVSLIEQTAMGEERDIDRET